MVGRRALVLASSRAVTFYDLHCELHLSRREASLTISNLIRQRHVVEVARVQAPGARKLVPQVTRVAPATVEDRLAALTALSQWPRRPAG